jgi:hypothetical protein
MASVDASHGPDADRSPVIDGHAVTSKRRGANPKVIRATKSGVGCAKAASMAAEAASVASAKAAECDMAATKAAAAEAAAAVAATTTTTTASHCTGGKRRGRKSQDRRDRHYCLSHWNLHLAKAT